MANKEHKQPGVFCRGSYYAPCRTLVQILELFKARTVPDLSFPDLWKTKLTQYPVFKKPQCGKAARFAWRTIRQPGLCNAVAGAIPIDG
jgi:hypothetical protein